MGKIPFDAASVDSIVAYAEDLIGYSLADLFPSHEERANSRNRGDLGGMVQKLFFGLSPDSRSEADFAMAGLELKTTGVRWGTTGQFIAKERLVLMMIDYEKIVHEEWESSSFLQKCRLILLLAYLYDTEKSIFDRKFVLRPMLLDLLSEEFAALREDWETIRDTVRLGNAHQLSEGDTFVLGACRKGSGGPSEKLRTQPFSQIGASSRAFSFRQSYLNRIIQTFGVEDAPLRVTEDPRNVPHRAFEEYLDKPVYDIGQHFSMEKPGPNFKGFHRKVAEKMLQAGGYSISALNSLGVEMKTIRLNTSGNPREAMSFPGFKFMEIVEQEWEESKFFEKLETKFLLIVFAQEQGGLEKLHKVAYWNMPHNDRVEAERVWQDTKRRVAIDATNLPKSAESTVAHVRPKGRDGNDKIITPQGTLHLRQCFWLNRSYLRNVVQSV